jgi:type II secretory pathway component PulM
MKTTAKIMTETLLKGLNYFYVTRTHRERKGLQLAFAVLLCTLLITTSIEPAVQTLLTKPEELINKKNQLAQALQLANEILTLQKNTK